MSDAPGPSQAPQQQAKRKTPWSPLRVVGLLVVVALVGAMGYAVFKVVANDREVDKRQAQLEPFYTPPAQVPDQPGVVIRSEPMPEVTLANGTAQRILYTSTNSDGVTIAVSGMVFLPKDPARPAPVVAWAHPTLGQADKCAPSRAANPLSDTQSWLDAMLGRGWVVAATDYAGLGTPGPTSYLLGEQSAQDLVNSVRAAKAVAQSVAQAQTSDEWVLWSHSQGGQAALWAAAKAPQIAPELSNLGVAAAAPAAELAEIMDAQWDKNVAWVIGPEATQTFVDAYPQLDVLAPLSAVAREDLDALEEQCTLGQGLQAEVLTTFDQTFFSTNPSQDPAWKQIVAEQTPPVPPAGVPVLLVQGTSDQVVLAPTNALLQTSWCAVGVNMTALWLGEVDHMKVAINGGPTVVQWAADRFAGVPQTPTCAFPPPVTPATPVD
ncbi:MAG: hypothetical protein QG597_2469 [Actinomycetota bacterium]|nr:hypothetical protein [Actinomycetota bacterium]